MDEGAAVNVHGDADKHNAVLGGVKTQNFDERAGGRGALLNAGGDYPAAALRDVETQQNSLMH